VATQQQNKERVEFATRKEHFEEAFRLVYEEYLRKGYCSQITSGMRATIYNALPETVTFCLWREHTLIATASLVPDSSIGLPMEKVYPEEIQVFREKGRKLCEISLLALNSDVIAKGILPLYLAERLRCLYLLFKPILWYARKTAVCTDICIAVNPVHKPLYSSLYFQEFGGERVYESVMGNPSIAMKLDLTQLENGTEKKTPGLYKLFLRNSLELKKISEFFRWNEQDFNYFFAEKSDALNKAKPEQIECLTRYFPELPIKQMAQQANPAYSHERPATKKCA